MYGRDRRISWRLEHAERSPGCAFLVLYPYMLAMSSPQNRLQEHSGHSYMEVLVPRSILSYIVSGFFYM